MATDSETVNAQILSVAQGPKKVTADGVTVEQYSIKELVEAQKQVAASEAATSTRRGLRIVKLVDGA